MSTLNVRTLRRGDLVVFTHPRAGYTPNQVAGREAGLRVGEKYRVERVAVGDWGCRIELVGVKGRFNSVHFDEAGK